jgi:hypothetical protein
LYERGELTDETIKFVWKITDCTRFQHSFRMRAWIGFPNPPQESYRVEAQKVLLAARVNHKVVTVAQELNHGLSGAFAMFPEHRMTMDVRILDNHIVSHRDEDTIELKLSQDMLFRVIRIKDDHCRPTLDTHADLLHDLRIGGTSDEACDSRVPDSAVVYDVHCDDFPSA